MEQNRLNVMRENRRLKYTLPAYVVLCVYLAINVLKYIENMPVALTTATLYGFAVLGAVALVLNQRIRLNRHSIWIIAVWCICLLSCLISKSVSTSWSTCVDYLKLVIFAVVFANIVDSRKRMEGVLAMLSVATIILFIYLAANDLLETEGRLGNELTGNANTFASLFMVGAFASVYFVFCRKSRIGKVLFTAAFIVQEYAIALSGGRKFFLLPLILYCGVLVFSTSKYGKRRAIRNGLLAVAVICVVFWAIFEVEILYEAIGYRMEGLLNSVTGEGQVDASTQSRKQMAKLGISLWTQSPLYGHGINTFKVINGQYAMYSHNNYVELLCGTGVIGATIYYAFHITSLFKLVTLKMRDVQKWYWILVMICMLAFDFGAVSYNLYPAQWMLMLSAAYLTMEKAEPASANQ